MNNRDSFRLIAEILSFDSSKPELKKKLIAKSIDWERIVKIASSHLVLPAIYCRLNQEKLNYLLPKELALYLSEITDINRNRNKALIQEARLISQLLNIHKIDHLYFKGMGMLIAGHYQDFGERMIGDMDILVRPKDIDEAYRIIEESGYTKSKAFDYDVKDFRHKPRQFKDDGLAAIELHDNILIKKKRDLLDLEDIFATSNESEGLWTPNPEYLHKINILTDQINNTRFYLNSVSLKSHYDNYVLEAKYHSLGFKKIPTNKYFKSYQLLFNYISNKKIQGNMTFNQKLRVKCFAFKLRYAWFGSTVFQIKSAILSAKKRLNLFFSNASYRKHIFENKLFTKSSCIFIL